MLDEANDAVQPSQTEKCQPLHIFVCINFVITIHVYVYMHTEHGYKGLYNPPQHYPLSNTISMLRNKTWDYSSSVTLQLGEGKGTAKLSAVM
jgi:hypothetical protein